MTRGVGWIWRWSCLLQGNPKLAHRHRHSSARGDRERSFSRHGDISNVHFINSFVHRTRKGIEFVDSAPAQCRQKINSSQVRELDLVLTKNDYANSQRRLRRGCVVDAEIFSRSGRRGTEVEEVCVTRKRSIASRWRRHGDVKL